MRSIRTVLDAIFILKIARTHECRNLRLCAIAALDNRSIYVLDNCSLSLSLSLCLYRRMFLWGRYHM